MSEEASTTEDKAKSAGMFDPAPKAAHECAIAAYLEANASDALREKIAEAQKSGKGVAQCYAYITEQARKQAAGVNSVMIADEVVYGWAVHYFEDEWRDEIERDRKREEERKANAKKAKRDAEARKAKREAEEAKRKAEAAKTEEERIAAMSPEEREAYERAKAEKEAAEAKRKAEAEAEAKAKAERKAQREAKHKAEEARKALREKWKSQQLSFNFG